MQLFTNLSRDRLEAIGKDLDVDLYGLDGGALRVRGKNKGRTEWKFVLRPATRETWRRVSAGYGTAGRRVWAVCWHGHYAFMYRVLQADPGARFVTAFDTWDGLEDFLERADDSQFRNIGPQIAPVSYGHACLCGDADLEAAHEGRTADVVAGRGA